MQELNEREIRRVAAAMYQPEPWDGNADGHRNPLYVYLDANAAQQQLTTARVVTL